MVTGFTLTQHAARMLRHRGIDRAWVARCLAAPDRIEPDRRDPSLRHALLPIPERDGRVLRVVYNATDGPPRVVTAFFDRSQRRRP